MAICLCEYQTLIEFIVLVKMGWRHVLRNNHNIEIISITSLNLFLKLGAGGAKLSH